jgi:excisionase family DNA binding protein
MSDDGLKPSDEGATDYMDTGQVAKYLGLEPEQVVELARQGKIPVLRFGDTLRFSRAGLMAWAVEAGFASLKQKM